VSNDVFYSLDGGESWWATGFPVTVYYGGVVISPTLGKVFAGGVYGLFVMDLVSGVDEGIALPGNLNLEQNYPNPFNSSTTISFSLPHSSWVEFSIYDALGRFVTTTFSGLLPRGNHDITLNAVKLSSGVYFCRMSTLGQTAIRKMVVLR
jgi:hypothetical protein